MIKESFCVVTFESTHDAIKTEKCLKAVLSVELIPTPREITASCGLSVKFDKSVIQKVRELVNALGTERKKLYSLDYSGDQRIVSALEWEE